MMDMGKGSELGCCPERYGPMSLARRYMVTRNFATKRISRLEDRTHGLEGARNSSHHQIRAWYSPERDWE